MSDDCEPPTVRDHAREEHANWVFAMRELERAIKSCPHDWSDGGTTINDIPREVFSDFEDAIRDWASSFVRLGSI